MGTYQHHVIIVYSFDKNLIEEAHEKAIEIFGKPFGFPYTKPMQISEIITTPVNDDYCFFIPPDGSKEGWDASAYYDKLRDSFFEWAENKYCLTIKEVSFGDFDDSIRNIDTDIDSDYLGGCDVYRNRKK